MWMLVAFIPFWLFIVLNLFFAFRGQKKNWLRVVYWLASAAWLVATSFVAVLAYRVSVPIGIIWNFNPISGLMGAIYGISLFVVWWLRPDFYYRWDQGRRPKAKEN